MGKKVETALKCVRSLPKLFGRLMKLIRDDAFDALVIVDTANLLPGILHELPFEKSWRRRLQTSVLLRGGAVRASRPSLYAAT
jgi:hypothetical protein